MEERFLMRAASDLILRKGDEILIVKRADCDMWSLPGGHLDGGETAREALVREAKEELGIDVQLEDVKFVNVAHRFYGPGDEMAIFAFEVSKWSGEPENLEPHKCHGLQWCALDNLPENFSGHKTQLLKDWYPNGIVYNESGIENL